MKILFVLENYFPSIGGVETLFKTLIHTLNQKGIDTLIITNKNHPELPKMEKDGLNTIFRYNFRNRYLFTLFATGAVIKHARSCDLIHTTSYNAGLPAFFGALFTRKKVLITFHEVWGNLWFKLPFFSNISKWLHYLFEQFLLKLPFTKFIAVSKYTAQRLQESGIREHKICTIYNGIEYDKWQTTQTGTEGVFTFLYFGRLGISKGLDLLIPAFKSFNKKHPQTRLILVIPKIENQISKWIKKEKSTFDHPENLSLMHNLTDDGLKKVIRECSCVVVPSYSEGFGYTALEAVAMEKTIISSGKGALNEVCSGKVIKMEDHSIVALQNAMQKALEGDFSQVAEKKFELKTTVEEYFALYKQMIDK